MSVVGIDVSRYQTVTPPLAGRSFLFARASIGTQRDPTYAMHIGNARAAGLIVGAYHFGDNRIPVADQARAFVAAAGDVDFYFLDVEGAHAMDAGQIRAFFAMVRAAGHRVGLYHSLSGFPELGQDYNWVAYWAAVPPSINWTFWQYRGSPLDLDRFIGTLDELRALAGRLPDTSTGDDMVQLNVTDAAPDPALVDLAIGVQIYALANPPEPKVKVASGGAGLYSPFASGNYRAVVFSTGGVRQLGLVRVADCRNVRPASDPRPAVRAVLDELGPAIADVIAQRRP
jgi:glycosyl hydrolase family 25